MKNKWEEQRWESKLDPLHVDPDERRKMLTLKVFVSYTSDLPKVIADFIKHICINEIESRTIQHHLKEILLED